MAPAGDVNGDGFDDIPIGAGVEPGGEAWVVSGKPASKKIKVDGRTKAVLAFVPGRADEDLGEALAGGGSIAGGLVPDLLVAGDNVARVFAPKGKAKRAAALTRATGDGKASGALKLHGSGKGDSLSLQVKKLDPSSGQPLPGQVATPYDNSGRTVAVREGATVLLEAQMP